jgi:hypothetical protein
MKLLRNFVGVALAALVVACASGSSFDCLPPLRQGQSEELRINIAHYPAAARTAYVVTPGEIATHQYSGSEWTIEVVQTPVADDVLVAAADLASLDGANLGCEIYDGDGATIEASLAGRVFSLTAANSDFCSLRGQDQASIRVNRVLNLIRALRGEAILAPSP